MWKNEPMEQVELRIEKRSRPLWVLVCDDYPDQMQRVYDRAKAVLDKLGVEASYDTFTRWQEIEDIHLERCDIALLDIDLEDPDQSGIDIARRLRAVNKRAMILFVTHFIEYAPEGYEVQAFRYVLKSDLHEMLGRYLLQAIQELGQRSDVLMVPGKNGDVEILIDGIKYLEVMGHDVSVWMRDGSCFQVAGSLTSYEQRLERHGFLRIHKSFLVNMRLIRRFQCREVLLSDGTVLRAGEKRYAELKQKYLRWKGSQV